MLTINMHQMSSQDIQMAMQKRCADRGSVDAVRLIPSEEAIVPPLALVLMCCRGEALQLRREVGNALAGQIVVVFLRDRAPAQTVRQRPAPVSSGLRSPS